ncbi:MAG: TonB-dependent receptor plug, partial [Bacteroidetes bacterium]|nr:TonB-dependent receptor plug [Bacteroidota bacterium]
MKKVRLLLAALLLFAGNVLEAQTSTVTGTVIDVSDGTPMIGVTAVIKGTRTGVSTDMDGKYVIKNVPPAATLVFQFIGYASQEIVVGNQSVIDVKLARETTTLEEVVITGYGVTTKKAFTGAASGVNKENISNKFEPNPIKNLQGIVPGLQMNTGSGQPGAPSTVFIRGRNSLNSGTQPLYVIDGVPIESDSHGMRSMEGQEVSALSSISSDDIESITVLKDATATSIYGARAANGVIVITTKRGKKGFSVNFSAKAGVEAMPNYPKGYKSVNSDQYLELSKEALMNAHTYARTLGKTSYFDYYNDAYELGLPYTDAGAREFLGWYSGIDVSETNTSNTDWMKEITRNGVIQNYTIEILGGGVEENSAKYFVSLDYLDNKAIVIGKDLNRYSFRFNFDQQPSKVIKFGFNSNLSYSVVNMGAGGGFYSDPITQAKMMSPLSPVKNADGNWNFGTVNGYNPVAQRSKLGDKSTAKQYRALLSPYLQINFTKDLFLLSRVGVDAYILDEFGYWSFLQPQGNSMRGLGENAYTANILLTTTNTLNYVKQFGQNNINILLGQEGQRTNYKTTYLEGKNYPVDYLNEVANTST